MITSLGPARVARSLQKVLVPIIYLVPIVHNSSDSYCSPAMFAPKTKPWSVYLKVRKGDLR